MLDNRSEPESDSVPPASLLYGGFRHLIDTFRRCQDAFDLRAKRCDLKLAANDFVELMAVIDNDEANKT